MGKGTIVGGGADGLYTVRIDFEKADIEKRIEKINERRAMIEIELAGVIDLINDTLVDLDEANDALGSFIAALNQYNANNPYKHFQYEEPPDATPEFRRAVAVASRRVIELSGELGLLVAKKEALQAEQLELLKWLAMLNKVIFSPVVTSAWCADLTENLTGEVGLIEINGERKGGEDLDNPIIIWPGNESATGAAYASARDGQLQPAIGGTPFGVFWNWTFLPGWQKWMPTYRIGEITGVDKTIDRGAVTLIEARSSAQVLNINQQLSYSGVPIVYMDCDSAVFAAGDRVVVQFEEVVAGEFSTWEPKIIGFETNPKPCAVAYEFAAELPGVINHKFRWFVVIHKKDGSWDCFSFPDHSIWQLLPSLSAGSAVTGVPAGDLTAFTVSKQNCQVRTSAEVDGRRKAWGAGTLIDQAQAPSFYCNVMIDTPIPSLPFWYHLIGGGLFGNDGPIISGITEDRNWIVSVMPSGRAQVSSLGGSIVFFGDPEGIDDKYKRHDRGENLFARGQWKLNSTCTQAISVLHGNEFLDDPMDPGFDETRILDEDEEPRISGAFLSAIYTLEIQIGESNTVTVKAQQHGEERSVKTFGLQYLLPEVRSEGSYYLAADYDYTDGIVYCYLDVEMEKWKQWDFVYDDCRQDKPYCTAYKISSESAEVDVFGVPPVCSGEEPSWQGQGKVFWEAPGSILRRVYEERYYENFVLKFSNEMPDVVIKYRDEVRNFTHSQGFSGYYQYDIRSDSPSLVPKFPLAAESYMISHLRSLSPGDPQSVSGVCLGAGEGITSASLHPNGVGYDDFELFNDRWTYANHITTRLKLLHLPSKTVAWEETKRFKADEIGEARLGINPQTGVSEGYRGEFTPTGLTTEIRHHLRSPHANKNVLESTDIIDALDPVVNQNWGFPPQVLEPGGNRSEEDRPLTTRLWHHQALGTLNPMTPGAGGAPIGFFGDILNYVPRQMARTHKTCAGHPEGHFAIHDTETDTDIIKHTNNVGHLISISHSSAIQKASEKAAGMIAKYLEANPEATEEEAAEATGAVRSEDLAILLAARRMGRGHFPRD